MTSDELAREVRILLLGDAPLWIEQFAAEAAEAGDLDAAAVAERALEGDVDAVVQVMRWIEVAR